MKFLTFSAALAAGLILGGSVGATQQGTTTTTTTTTTERTTTITPEQRTVIRRSVGERPAFGGGVEVRVGGTVPGTVELYDVPQTVVTEVPAYSKYKVFRTGERTVVVDPATNRIVEVIE